ncbi:MAG TPA: hypothetical protein VKV95_05855 [Terriglobia bacterium]|nr:hypothetical protein [Terriglobia bacterium]
MSNSPTFTFDEIEGYTGRAYAFAVFVTYAKHGARIIFGIIAAILLARKLDRLVRMFSCQRIEKFSKDQADQLMALLQPLHSQLIKLFPVNVQEREEMKKFPILGRIVTSIESDTEGIEDILEDIALLHDKEFQGLIAGAIKDVRMKRENLETVHN